MKTLSQKGKKLKIVKPDARFDKPKLVKSGVMIDKMKTKSTKGKPIIVLINI